MRHVRQKFGFIFRRERKLGGLFLKRVTRLLDFGVLAFHLGVLLGEQSGLGPQFLVGLLQLTLAGLKLGRQLLRLRQQAFGTHRRFDGIEDRADALRQQFEKRQRPVAEILQSAQLDDRLGMAFKQHRQHDDTHLLRLAQTRRNSDEIRWHIGEQDAFLFHRALAD